MSLSDASNGIPKEKKKKNHPHGGRNSRECGPTRPKVSLSFSSRSRASSSPRLDNPLWGTDETSPLGLYDSGTPPKGGRKSEKPVKREHTRRPDP